MGAAASPCFPLHDLALKRSLVELPKTLDAGKISVIVIGGSAGAKMACESLALQGTHVLGVMGNFTKRWDAVPRPNDFGDYTLPSNLEILRRDDVRYFVAAGDNTMRKNITEDLMKLVGRCGTGMLAVTRLVNCIHPTAILAPSASLGHGIFVGPRVVVNTGACIEDGCWLESGCIVEHDNVLRQYVHLGPGAQTCGYVTLCSASEIGGGSTVIPRITVGRSAVIAAGATVTRDVAPQTMVAGVPAVFKKMCNAG